MKKLSSITNKKIELVSLESLDFDVQDKLNNLNGRQINECCCDCCKCCEPTCSSEPQFIFFYSESEIVNVLKTTINVQTLFNLHNQFGYRFRYMAENPGQANNPLYFKEIVNPYNDLMASLQANMHNVQYSSKFYQFILELENKYGFTYPVILSKADNTTQIFFIKGTGTNGKEGSIKNSLLEIYELLGELDGNKQIIHSQVLDVSIDNCDDVYTFVVTCTVNSEDFPNDSIQSLTNKKQLKK